MDKVIPKAADRLAVLEKISEYEKKGWFDIDVENDPPWTSLKAEKLDLTKKKLLSKIKTRLGNFMGRRYFNRLMKKRAVIFKGAKGLENLEGFSGGAIVTCNHIHQFDNYAAFLGLGEHFTDKKFRLYKIVREGNYSYPGIVGFLIRNCNTLPVGERERPNYKLTAKTMQGVKYFLERGEKILVFAEQAMWWNYRKPRPLKKGAFLFAAKFNVPIIPCFLTLSDSDIIGKDGFPVQEFTLNILPLIYPDESLSTAENADIMKEKNAELWKNLYEHTYGEPLCYHSDSAEG